MGKAIGFDVYGTLANPHQIDRHLTELIGEQAASFAKLWREKQLEYAFRKGLMNRYENFEICTRQALSYCITTFDASITQEQQEHLMKQYQHLPAFADAAAGLEQLKSQGHRLVAFSNGLEKNVRKLLENAGLLQYLENVISVDDVRQFKPHPQVYQHLAKRLNTPVQDTWLVSSNPWDVIGAKSAGLHAAWVQRNKRTVFDPWNVEPDLVAESIPDLALKLK
ncbi:haloacid dehalogenase type II [Pontibacter ruber]|uniref:Haloacid dehalogenase type II n=1 Tax=Pontibacter ruber TaxID=1343895 RepID=A0ABW5CTT8_9BACT|nr:haloacid dehalogenase type II [Pontibacter ruber]